MLRLKKTLIVVIVRDGGCGVSGEVGKVVVEAVMGNAGGREIWWW